jgi:DNA-binding MarR family transcriptional regulator
MNKYKQTICRKLDINYGYLHNILGQMEERKWIRKIRSNMRVYYVLLADAPLTEAKEFLSKQEDKENEITRNRAKEN